MTSFCLPWQPPTSSRLWVTAAARSPFCVSSSRGQPHLSSRDTGSPTNLSFSSLQSFVRPIKNKQFLLHPQPWIGPFPISVKRLEAEQTTRIPLQLRIEKSQDPETSRAWWRAHRRPDNGLIELSEITEQMKRN